MTSQGQRFRRRALRRGYKVDEVDAFLDRVEDTLAGEAVDAPVTAQEVHDVVFRVRFGGYDEWQVDLHLDRVERQLAEVATQHEPGFGRGPEPRGDPYGGELAGRSGQYGPPERMGPPPGPGLGAAPGRGPGHGPGPGPGMGPGRGPGPGPSPMGSAMPGQPGPPQGNYPDAGYERYDEPTYGGFDGHPPGRPGMLDPGADRFASEMTSEMRLGDAGGPPMPRPGGPDAGPLGPGHGGPGGPGMGPDGSGLPRRTPAGLPPGEIPGPGAPPPPMSPVAPPPGVPGAGFGAGPGGPNAPANGDLQRLDQMRRTFQPRRFGSGYDRAQVDRLFDELMAVVSGQGPMPVNDAELDPGRFDLVPGGYFEAEVEQALHEVRDILRRH